MFCLAVLTIIVNGSKLNQITRGFGISLRGREWFGLSSITTTLNNVFFKAGSLVTSNYLKRKHDFPYMSFIGSLGADQLILLFINSLAGGIIFFTISTQNDIPYKWVGTAYLLAAVVLLLVMMGKVTLKNRNHFIWDALARILQSLNRILQNKKIILYPLCPQCGPVDGIIPPVLFDLPHPGADRPFCILFFVHDDGDFCFLRANDSKRCRRP